jgi:predicted nuclease with RNAse H fold
LKFACLDIAQARCIDVVYVDAADRVVHHETMRGSDQVVNWARRYDPIIIAIDGPSKPNCGRTREPEVRQQLGLGPDIFSNFRVCEVLLKQRGIGLYNTSTYKPAGWIKSGWDVYGALQAKGYRLWDQPGPVRVAGEEPRIIEVHPHACFVVGLGWIPPDKKGLAGHLVRAAYLRRHGILGDEPLRGECWPREDMLVQLARALEDATWEKLCSDGLRIPDIDHDLIDALGGLLTAIRFAEGHAFAVGEVEEGVILLPREPTPIKEPYTRQGSGGRADQAT